MNNAKQNISAAALLAGGIAGGALLGGVNDIKPVDVIPNRQDVFDKCIVEGGTLEHCQEQMFVIAE